MTGAILIPIFLQELKAYYMIPNRSGWTIKGNTSSIFLTKIKHTTFFFCKTVIGPLPLDQHLDVGPTKELCQLAPQSIIYGLTLGACILSISHCFSASHTTFPIHSTMSHCKLLTNSSLKSHTKEPLEGG